MNNVKINEDMVTVEAGANWGNVYSALDNSNYVAVGGCVPAVGIGGYILGGGYSMLSRACGGLACDKAVSYTMVTASGKDVVNASDTENQDLFWALKGGGGGNFGVLVDVTLKVCPRPHKFIWNRLIYDDTESTERGLNAVGARLKSLPKELNLDMAIHSFFGKRVLTLDAVFSDHHEDQVKDALNRLHPTRSTSQIVYASFLKFVEDYSKRHGFVHYEVEPIYVKGLMIDSLPPDLAKYFSGLDIPSECLLEFVHMGGDIQKYSTKSTAFPHRSAEYSFYTYGRFSDDKYKEEAIRFATSTYNDLKESTCALGSYINYMDRDLKDWAREYYGVNYPQLLEVKDKWNPVGQGSLHFQQEIGSTWESKS